MPRHRSVCPITRKNLILERREVTPRFGAWKLRLEDLSRYGRGGCCVMVYATTFPGCATYCSPGLSVTWYICPGPANATRPLPVISVLPQCARLIPRFAVGETESVWPVQARRAFRCATIQSTVPLRCNTVKEVSGDLVDIKAVMGLVEEIRWYRKGIPSAARRKGSRMDKVDCAWVIC